MDFLSKINASAGIDVKKELTVSDSNSNSPTTKISGDSVLFNPSEFSAVLDKSFDVSLTNGLGAEIGMSISKGTDEEGKQGIIKLYHNGPSSSIEMNTEFIMLEMWRGNASHSSLKLNGPKHSIDISASRVRTNITGKGDVLDINTEFLKLDYGTKPNEYHYAGPTLKIISNDSAGDIYNEESDPTAEISSQRLNISAFTANQNVPGYINLIYTPTDKVDPTTKEIIDHESDTYMTLDENGVNIESPNSDIYLGSRNGGIYIESASTSLQSHVNTSGQGGDIYLGSDTDINVSSGRDITLTANKGNGDTGAKIDIKFDSSIHLSTTEFLVNQSSYVGAKSRFVFGNRETRLSQSGLQFISGNQTSKIETDGTLEITSPQIVQVEEVGTFRLGFKDYGGCMLFNKEGINVNVTNSEGKRLCGHALISNSVFQIERMTQSEFDAIETKDENTLYIIAG